MALEADLKAKIDELSRMKTIVTQPSA